MQSGEILQQRYQLQKVLGHTSGRETWLAKDLTDQSAVVVKLLVQHPQLQWQDIKLFEREVTVLRNLQHPNIPRYRDAFKTELAQGSHAIWLGLVQDYVVGINLQKRLDYDGKLTEKQVRKIAIETLKILIDLHELNPPVLHRDLKPSNLLLGEDQQIYLIDFGAVQNRAKAERATMTMVGTYGYTPLEQFRGQTVPASDLYALGATLIHLLTGIAPSELPQKQLQLQFVERVALSPSFQQWLETLVEPTLEHRFRTARQALEALQTGINQPLNVIAQPSGSRVRLHLSQNCLMIESPALRTSYLSMGLTLGLLASLAIFLQQLTFLAGFMSVVIMGFVSLLWLVWGIILIYWINRYIRSWRCQLVQFTNTHFVIEEQNLGIKYFQHQRSIQAIQQVQHSVQKRHARSLALQMGKAELDIVALQTSNRTYRIGLDLTAAECAWLAQRLNDWLKQWHQES